jgi:hypothetical protein
MKKTLVLIGIIFALSAFNFGDDEAITCSGITGATYSAASVTVLQKARYISVQSTCDQPVYLGLEVNDDRNVYIAAGAAYTFDMGWEGGAAGSTGGFTGSIYAKKVGSAPTTGTLYITYGY